MGVERTFRTAFSEVDMHGLSHPRVLVLALLAAGALATSSPSPEPLDGAWLARNVRWRAPRALTPAEQSDPSRRPSETVLLDLRLEIRQDGDSLWGHLSSVRDPEDARWRRILVGRRIGDSVFLAAPASPGQPNLTFEGAATSAELTGRLKVPPATDLRPGLLRTPAGAKGRQALPEFPVRDQWLPIQFQRAPE